MNDSTCIIGGRRIAYLDQPASTTGPSDRDDPTTVVFVHGNSSSARTWLPVIDEIGRRHRCVAVDLPGHGRSAAADDPDDYSVPGHAHVLIALAGELDVRDAVFVGWSLGGQIVFEAAPALPAARGFVVFGAPPVASPAQMAEAFLPNPAMSAMFTDEVSPDDARRAAASLLAPSSTLDTADLIADIQATDGTARAALGASAGAGQFADEVAVVAGLHQPLAILHGAEEQLVDLGYLQRVTAPSLWRGAVQVLPGVGHAPHLEAPRTLSTLLEQFLEDLEHRA